MRKFIANLGEWLNHPAISDKASWAEDDNGWTWKQSAFR